MVSRMVWVVPLLGVNGTREKCTQFQSGLYTVPWVTVPGSIWMGAHGPSTYLGNILIGGTGRSAALFT